MKPKRRCCNMCVKQPNQATCIWCRPVRNAQTGAAGKPVEDFCSASPHRPDRHPGRPAALRLSTRAPIYIDFKAVPYAPAEVIEWYNRVLIRARWYKQRLGCDWCDQ